jgi:hypothetical protein
MTPQGNPTCTEYDSKSGSFALIFLRFAVNCDPKRRPAIVMRYQAEAVPSVFRRSVESGR